MKKFLMALLLALAGTFLFAASYKNNTYQKLAEEYTVKAQTALDAGDWEKAADYAQKAEENAALSEAFIRRMMAKNDADKNMKLAKNRIDYVQSIRGEENFPIAYKAALELYAQAENLYANEDFEAASASAQLVLQSLAEVREITPLPKFYIVRPWAQTKDCFWNISGRPYVYNNPWLWENLYQANKNALPKPENPNLILPGMKMEIPSISGEYRDGVYSPDTQYDAYSANR